MTYKFIKLTIQVSLCLKYLSYALASLRAAALTQHQNALAITHSSFGLHRVLIPKKISGSLKQLWFSGLKITHNSQFLDALAAAVKDAEYRAGHGHLAAFDFVTQKRTCRDDRNALGFGVGHGLRYQISL